MPRPCYLDLSASDLAGRATAALALQSPCRLCPRECRAQRATGQRGHCGAGAAARVASAGPHFGEERPLVGRGGSGTIFFSYCSLRCLFCQNADLAHEGHGQDVTTAYLAGLMLRLQQDGCHNLNLVTPTHYLPQILQALAAAVPLGLRLPLVYNCGGYEALEALALLDGVVDIYMPDAKFADPQVGARLCGVPDYPSRMQAAIREMHRQVGDLQLDEAGLACRGLLVRHLVLPDGEAGTAEVTAFLASLSPATYTNLMDQYRPCYRATEDEHLRRGLTAGEHAAAVREARAAGLWRLDEA